MVVMTAFPFYLTKNVYVGNLFQVCCGICSQFVFVSRNLLHTDGRNVIQYFGKPGGTDISRRFCLELERKFVEFELCFLSGKKIRPQPFQFLNNCLPGIYHKPVNPEGVGIQTSFFLQLPFENFLFEL